MDRVKGNAECDLCQGRGTRVYSNTATWRSRPGVVSGAAMTTDVCDKCWGSGYSDKPWPSHADFELLQVELADAKADAKAARGARDAEKEALTQTDAELAQAVKERDALGVQLSEERSQHSSTKRSLQMFKDRAEDSVWLWQGHGDDDLATLACPVMIAPEDLASILKELAKARQEIDWANREYAGDHDAVEAEIIASGRKVPDVCYSMAKLRGALKTANENTRRRGEQRDAANTLLREMHIGDRAWWDRLHKHLASQPSSANSVTSPVDGPTDVTECESLLREIKWSVSREPYSPDRELHTINIPKDWPTRVIRRLDHLRLERELVHDVNECEGAPACMKCRASKAFGVPVHAPVRKSVPPEILWDPEIYGEPGADLDEGDDE